jgi:ABC-type polysaccharide/polyol phosphate export permease
MKPLPARSLVPDDNIAPRLHTVWQFLTTVYWHRRLVASLAGRELKVRYAGTAIGTLWAVLPQVLMVGVYWFVFSVGLKVTPSHGVPFIVFFVCGFIPWTMFNETIMASSSAVQRNAHLVKKTVFPIEVLPISELVIGLVGHAVMLSVLLIILWFNGVTLSAYVFQVFYYLLALSVFCIAVGLSVCAMNVLTPDVGHALIILMNVWFWLTPIVWDVSILTGNLRLAFTLNPLFYIVDGYRASFIYHEAFWQSPAATIWFWVTCLLVLATGMWMFEKLKPKFAEVL